MTGPLILKDNPAEDLEAATKQYVDNHTSDVVLYTPQTLSDEQKVQARGNINSAPDGFGLGGAAKMLTAADNVDNIRASGWYTWSWDPAKQPAGLPDESKYHTGLMRVDSANPVTYDNVQTIYIIYSPPTSNPGDQCVIQRMGLTASDVWNPFEWVNPPMNLGTEYRTTERYLGKPVYVKMVNLGEGTNGKTVNVGTMEMIHVECRAIYSGWSLPMPELPFGSTDKSLEHTNAQAFYSNANTVTIIMGSTCPAFTATAKVYYVKSTD